ncbi:AAA family ATPase [Lactococcus lactis]|uniref:AAA family ATPase n=1 Tax=Lactococcus lactis TaxID=1358 RepID=UPI0018C77C45|nr:AAA family ATPase [Lactococcus lactis]MBG1279471.1 AAA family ATPase [Lactococcus lactis subsp. lactis]
MWAKKIELHDFRAFENFFEMDLAKNITCISGHNGIGKSTILAVLNNCGELKKSCYSIKWLSFSGRIF